MRLEQGDKPGADSGASDIVVRYKTFGICWGASTLIRKWVPGEIQQGLKSRTREDSGGKHISEEPVKGVLLSTGNWQDEPTVRQHGL